MSSTAVHVLFVVAGIVAGSVFAVVVVTLLARRGSGVRVAGGVPSQAVPGGDGDAVQAAIIAEQRVAALETMLSSALDRMALSTGQQLEAHGRAASGELGLRHEAIDRRVDDMNTELARIRDLVTQMQRDRAEQHGQLVASLAETTRVSGELVGTTQALREALSSSRARGVWGERMAEDVLRLAGFEEGVSFRRQVTLVGGGRPDITFMLPEGRELHMDVKFPMDNYMRHLDASEGAESDAAAQAFVRDVRARIKELTGRGYLDSESSVGYVLMFIPNESVYGFIHATDPRVVDYALEHGVVMCSPFTLFAVLGVIRQAVDSFQLARMGDDILHCFGEFTKQWTAFSEKLDRLGSQLGTVQRTYDELSGVRRRQLTRQLDEIERLRTQEVDRAPSGEPSSAWRDPSGLTA